MLSKLKEKLKKIVEAYQETELPECIEKKANIYLFLGIITIIGSLLFGIVSLFSGNPSLTLIFPLFIGTCLLCIGIYVRLNVAINGISIQEGECINITEAGNGKLLVFQNFANSNIGINVLIQTKTELISVIISDNKQLPVIGQHIRLYLPAKPTFYRNAQGIIQYQNVYGMEFFVEEDLSQ